MTKQIILKLFHLLDKLDKNEFLLLYLLLQVSNILHFSCFFPMGREIWSKEGGSINNSVLGEEG